MQQLDRALQRMGSSAGLFFSLQMAGLGFIIAQQRSRSLYYLLVQFFRCIYLDVL